MNDDVVIVGDVWPTGDSLCRMLRAINVAPPRNFFFTLDASVPVGAPRPSQTLIAFSPEQLGGIDVPGECVAILADNHVTDYSDGLRAVLEALAASSIKHVGAGMNQNEAERSVRLTVAGRVVEVVAFAENHSRVGAVMAATSSAGVADLAEAERVVRAARAVADEVWVFLHWGTEFVRVPDQAQRRCAAELADAGATLIVGSHAHVPLGYERIRGADIFYGLGNFHYPGFVEARGYQYRWHRRARRGVALCGRLTTRGFDWRPQPFVHDRHGAPQRASSAMKRSTSLPLHLPLSAYSCLYPFLRSAERAGNILERLVEMSPDERLWRLRQITQRAKRLVF